MIKKSRLVYVPMDGTALDGAAVTAGRNTLSGLHHASGVPQLTDPATSASVVYIPGKDLAFVSSGVGKWRGMRMMVGDATPTDAFECSIRPDFKKNAVKLKVLKQFTVSASRVWANTTAGGFADAFRYVGGYSGGLLQAASTFPLGYITSNPAQADFGLLMGLPGDPTSPRVAPSGPGDHAGKLTGVLAMCKRYMPASEYTALTGKSATAPVLTYRYLSPTYIGFNSGYVAVRNYLSDATTFVSRIDPFLAVAGGVGFNPQIGTMSCAEFNDSGGKFVAVLTKNLPASLRVWDGTTFSSSDGFVTEYDVLSASAVNVGTAVSSKTWNLGQVASGSNVSNTYSPPVGQVADFLYNSISTSYTHAPAMGGQRGVLENSWAWCYSNDALQRAVSSEVWANSFSQTQSLAETKSYYTFSAPNVINGFRVDTTAWSRVSTATATTSASFADHDGTALYTASGSYTKTSTVSHTAGTTTYDSNWNVLSTTEVTDTFTVTAAGTKVYAPMVAFCSRRDRLYGVVLVEDTLAASASCPVTSIAAVGLSYTAPGSHSFIRTYTLRVILAGAVVFTTSWQRVLSASTTVCPVDYYEFNGLGVINNTTAEAIQSRAVTLIPQTTSQAWSMPPTGSCGAKRDGTEIAFSMYAESYLAGSPNEAYKVSKVGKKDPATGQWTFLDIDPTADAFGCLHYLEPL